MVMKDLYWFELEWKGNQLVGVRKVTPNTHRERGYIIGRRGQGELIAARDELDAFMLATKK